MAVVKKAAMSQGPEPGEPLMTKWNMYLDYLDKIGMRGKAELDKGGLGFKVLEEYNKKNPSLSVSKDEINKIQVALEDYRDWVIEGHKSGKRPVKFSGDPGQNYENFMSNIQIRKNAGKEWSDGYPGEQTTSVRFPKEYLSDVELGLRKDIGFAPNKAQEGSQPTQSLERGRMQTMQKGTSYSNK
jgi:hypothetical protein